MQVYIFMGTHLPEISRCIDHLVKSSRDLDPVEVHVPVKLDWSGDGERYRIIEYDPDNVLWVFDPDKDGCCFLVVDPRSELIPQLEQLATDLGKCLIEPVKILTCVDCERAEQDARLKGWLDACIYYSDIILLGNRENAPKSFVRDFQKHYERQCYPCLFLFLKGPGIPSGTGEILTPGARRISQMFDLPESLEIPEIPGIVVESSCDLDLQESEADPYRLPEEDASASHVPDPSQSIVYPEKDRSKNP